MQRNLLRLAPGFFEENRPSEIASRMTSDTTVIEQVVGTTVSVALRNMVMGIGGIAYLGFACLSLVLAEVSGNVSPVWLANAVVVAVLLTLAVVVDAATGRAKAAPTSTPSLITAEVSQLPGDTDLIKARIRLATGL